MTPVTRRFAIAALALLGAVSAERRGAAQPAQTSYCYNYLPPANRPLPNGCSTCFDGTTSYTFANRQGSTYPVALTTSMVHIQGPAGTPNTYPADGSLSLDGSGIQVLNPDNIQLPFNEDVKILMVSKGSGTTNAGTLGWFFLDQLNASYVNNGTTYPGKFTNQDSTNSTYLYDCDGDGIRDFFQGPIASVLTRKPGLWVIDQVVNADTPAIAVPQNYSDHTAQYAGGHYPHIPDILETPNPFISPSNVGNGGIIFPLAEDDADTLPSSTTTPALSPVFPNPVVAPWTSSQQILDVSSTVDGIPDYDVNGDGIVGNEADRVVDLGVLQGSREIVFYYVSYDAQSSANSGTSSWTLPSGAMGVKAGTSVNGTTAPATETTKIIPWFTKKALNPDSYFNYSTTSTPTAGTPIANIDVGCTTPSGCSCTSTNGCSTTTTFQPWLDSATLSRLQTVPAYNNFIFNTATTGNRYTLCAGSNSTSLGTCPDSAFSSASVLACPTFGSTTTVSDFRVPHVLAGAPANDPDRWVFGFEDSPIFTTSACTGGVCATSADKKDYNDAVFLVQRQNGGTITSQVASTEIPPSQIKGFTLDRIHISATAAFPAPCPTPPAGATLGAGTNTRIELYYSVDDKTNGSGAQSWWLVPFPAAANPLKGDATVSLLKNGAVGDKLTWQARIITNVDGCQPKLTQLFAGYEALKGQPNPFTYAEPIAVGNLMIRSAFWPSVSTWTTTANDRSVRGYIKADILYDPTTGADYSFSGTSPAAWTLAADGHTAAAFDTQRLNPDSATLGRTILFNDNGTAVPLTAANDTTLYPLVLPSSVRSDKFNGRLLNDYNGDGQVTIADADWIIEWTRGWENWTSAAVRGIPPLTIRAEILGAMQWATPAILTPPQTGSVSGPWWITGSRTPAAENQTAYIAASAAWPNRTTNSAIVVGAADGMIHAFNLGGFTYADGANGAFTGTPLYGDGKELWAFVPQAQLSKLRNNIPMNGVDNEAFTAQYPSADPLLHPRASMDAAGSLADVYFDPSSYPNHSGFRTVAVVPEGPHPYVTALDVTDSLHPTPLWTNDWTDPDYEGTHWSVDIGPADTADAAPNDRVFVAATTSGLTDTLGDMYLFLINLATGATHAKVQLTSGTGYGSNGFPISVDSDGDGVIDRYYVTLTDSSGLGHVIKVNTTGIHAGSTVTGAPAPTVCDLTPASSTAALNESVYAPPAVMQNPSGGWIIATAGGDHPDLIDGVGSYHVFVIQDNDAKGACNTTAAQVTSFALPANRKVWTAPGLTPATSTDPATVIVTTSYGDVSSICGDDVNNPGALMAFPIITGANNSVAALYSFNLPTNGTGVVVYPGGSQVITGAEGGSASFVGTNKWPTGPLGVPASMDVPLMYEDRTGLRCQ